ncbi:MAG: Anaerobic nitric oxide reductase transcription regulator NorR [Myxococcota bacterium]|nr:Anaerobic nitric oxide reductase transcription regulator NorR [Myxococcota bacterium]
MLRLTLHFGLSNQHSVEFQSGEVMIGRKPHCSIAIVDPRISGQHARLYLQGSDWIFEDLFSTNGSMIHRSGQRTVVAPGAPGRQKILTGDELLLGDADTPIVIRVDEAAAGETPSPARETVVAVRALKPTFELPPRVREDGAALRDLCQFMGEQARTSELADQFVGLFRFFQKRFSGDIWFYAALRDFPQGEFRKAFSRSSSGKEPADGAPPSLRERLLSEKQAILLKETRGAQQSEPAAASGVDSIMAAPLMDHAGKVFGLFLLSRRGREFDEADLALFAAAAAHAGSTFETIRLVDELKAAREQLSASNKTLLQDIAKSRSAPLLIGESPAIRKVLKASDAVAGSDSTVLIQGETGVGKEVLARHIHGRSARADRYFAAVNCGALTATLLESELFGHVKGAFTGATSNKKGYFSIANHGTLFLDEIGEIPLQLQVKLLRVLQEGEFWPVGADKPETCDVRILAATNRVLETEVKEGRFREDLYFRLNVFPIRVPPLRERQEDIPLLVNHLLERLRERHPNAPQKLTERAMACLCAFPWPGNIRQLSNELERACLLSGHSTHIDVDALSPEIAGEDDPDVVTVDGTGRETLKETMRRLEKGVIKRALDEHHNNKTATARALGISRQALLLKINMLGVD